MEKTRKIYVKFLILLKILWKMEHLLKKSKCCISHNIFKDVVFQRRGKALLWSKRLKPLQKLYLKILSAQVVWYIFLLTLLSNISVEANSVDPDQTAPRGAV